MDQPSPENPVPSQGPVVGIIVVIIVLVFGAFYFFTQVANFTTQIPADGTNADVSGFPAVSESDEEDDIARDLDAEDFNDIDAELNAIDAELAQ